ncbi:hypothetical protein PIROE2DRAFT_8894 [Piromyces sp. E2]|nr:hypothetical protein PIROE2DRAFT_8894 [Piromyces sp. E2]|eukprot:OUM64341.1 hypothetical protein PIROE2DRAFT_8894 [Piromyces sp. E2]
MGEFSGYHTIKSDSINADTTVRQIIKATVTNGDHNFVILIYDGIHCDGVKYNVKSKIVDDITFNKRGERMDY